MEGWKIEVLKYVAGGVAGWWSHWTWTRRERIKAELREKDRQAEHDQKLKDADLREQQRQAEYEDFKKKRRLIGAGEVERMERAEKLTDLIIKQKQHDITADEFNARREELLNSHRRKMKGQQGSGTTIDERGPNDGPVEILPNGDKVEWVRDEDEDGRPVQWAMILMRNENDIRAAEDEFFEKVWWNRHQLVMEMHDSGKHPVEAEILKTATERAAQIEDKYGSDELVVDTFEWGMTNGKLSALRWVLGNDWDILDT